MNRHIYVPLLTLFFGLSACSNFSMPPMSHEKKAEEREVKTVKLTDALFCFKCHSAARYEGKAGGFPHIKHRTEFGIDLHCNQCHELRGHQKMKVIQRANAPCSNCH